MCDETKKAARESIFLKLLVLCATEVNLSFYISHLRQPYFLDPLIQKTSVVQKVDNTIHWINLYLLNSPIPNNWFPYYLTCLIQTPR